MFGLGFGEILVVLVLALLVLGPQKLPEVAQQLARLLGELRRVADDVRQQFEAPEAPPPPPKPLMLPPLQAPIVPPAEVKPSIPVTPSATPPTAAESEKSAKPCPKP